MERMLGKRRAKRNMKLMALSSLTRKAILSPPPEIVDWIWKANDKPDWSMFANDKIGDCTVAAAANLMRVWSTVARRPPILLTDAEVIGAYSAITGYVPGAEATDQGAVIDDVLGYWQHTGIGGHRIDARVTVDPLDTDQLRDAIAWYGGIDVGLQLPLTAQTQLDAGEPWDVVATSPNGQQLADHPHVAPNSWGGHSVAICGYDPEHFYSITWGKVQAITPEFLKVYCDEAFGCISHDWIRDNDLSPSELHFETLLKDAGYLKGN